MTQKKKTMTKSPFKILDEIKFKEIKQLTEKIFVASVDFNSTTSKFNTGSIEGCWGIAEAFYEFIDKKEQEICK